MGQVTLFTKSSRFAIYKAIHDSLIAILRSWVDWSAYSSLSESKGVTTCGAIHLGNQLPHFQFCQALISEVLHKWSGAGENDGCNRRLGSRDPLLQTEYVGIGNAFMGLPEVNQVALVAATAVFQFAVVVL